MATNVTIHKKMVMPLTTKFLRDAFASADTVVVDLDQFNTPAKRKLILAGGIRRGPQNFNLPWTKETMRYMVEGDWYLTL